jgi:hypothetical protein
MDCVSSYQVLGNKNVTNSMKIDLIFVYEF